MIFNPRVTPRRRETTLANYFRQALALIRSPGQPLFGQRTARFVTQRRRAYVPISLHNVPSRQAYAAAGSCAYSTLRASAGKTHGEIAHCPSEVTERRARFWTKGHTNPHVGGKMPLYRSTKPKTAACRCPNWKPMRFSWIAATGTSPIRRVGRAIAAHSPDRRSEIVPLCPRRCANPPHGISRTPFFPERKPAPAAGRGRQIRQVAGRARQQAHHDNGFLGLDPQAPFAHPVPERAT